MSATGYAPGPARSASAAREPQAAAGAPSSANPAPPAIDRRVAAEVRRIAMAGDSHAAAFVLVSTLFVVSALAPLGVPLDVQTWCVACVALILLRRFAVRGAAGGDAAAAPRHARWLALLAASSAAWGMGPPIILALHRGQEALVTGVWLATAALAIPKIAASRPALYIALLCGLIPLPIALALQHGAATMLLAVLSAAFLVALLRQSLEQNDLLRVGLAAQMHNEDLVLELRAQVELAARAVEEKTRFLASAAHDLRQPLHALGMFCAALDQRLQNVPEKPLIRNMMDSIEALERSFGAMLDISRLDAGIVQKSVQSFPIRDLLRRLYQQFGGDAEARDLGLRFRAAQRVVRSDPQLLERVLVNLVQNALRYTRRGGVLVAARRHRDGVAVEVWDTGVGIAPDQIELIFREFYQVDNPERDRSRGLGMGLAIVQRLCALMDHRLEVRSWPGRGSVFRVIIAESAESPVDLPDLEADTLPPSIATPVTILLIEDERAIREATTELLRPMAAEVLAAATIGEAVDLAGRAGRIDLILSDWRLRGNENGVDAVRAVRAVCGESTPAVLVTGDTSPDVLKTAHESGLVVMHKPLQPRELMRLVERLSR